MGRGEFLTKVCLLGRPLGLLIAITMVPQASDARPCSQTIAQISVLETVKDKVAKGFTLMEVLVTTSVIAILVGILIPSLGHARGSARNVKCLSNLHQIHLATQMYEDTYRSLPVHVIDNQPGGSYASVNLREAMDIDPGIYKAFQCPADQGQWSPETNESFFYSYIYFGLSSMISRSPPHYYSSHNSRINYERDQTKPLYYRMPVFQDARGFHESKKPSPNYDGKMNAYWYDGRVDRVPTERPPGPVPPW